MVGDANRLEDICKDLNEAGFNCYPEFLKTCKLKVEQKVQNNIVYRACRYINTL
jgi:hypothetical protein